MDLLFKRYASPFLYLDNLIDNGMLLEGVYQLIKSDNDEKEWELYLHSSPFTAPHKAFNEWKAELLDNTPTQHQSMSEDELKTAKENADRILNIMRK